MTSDDTHALTEALLKDNGYFGLEPDQVTIMKQNKVPALEDSTARFACKDGVITTKPHGHGDVHTLMHQTGLAGQWATSGVKWIVFFQVHTLAFTRAHTPTPTVPNVWSGCRTRTASFSERYPQSWE
jgi:UDP-sugar pyrophosphorylase